MTETFTAFDGQRRLATGPLAQIASAAMAAAEQGGAVLVFDDETGRVVDLDPRAPAEPVRRPGRPKLGVVAREVTLLPPPLGVARAPAGRRLGRLAQAGRGGAARRCRYGRPDSSGARGGLSFHDRDGR
ncbi:MAG: DUF2239 family protein [Aliidongia sp.]